MRAGPAGARLTSVVLQLTPRLDRDGIGRDVVDLARHLRLRGWRALASSRGGPLERELAAAGGIHLPLPIDADGRIAIWRNRSRLARTIRAHGVSLVHAHGPLPAASGAAAAHASGIPFVATVHDADGLSGGRGADRVIAVSNFVAEGLVLRHGVSRERLRVVRRWIDSDEFDPEQVRGHRILAVAERWCVGHGPKVVLVPPLHEDDQGHLLLLHAMARLPRTDCVALLLGELDERADYGDSLVTAVRKAGLGERVRFGGAVDDLPAALSLADVVVVPATRPDPSGFLAVAAQAMGKPVIVTNVGALAEAVMPAATGWLVSPDDPGELARALDLALSLDDDTRGGLASRARAFVGTEFGLEPMCDRILAVYSELIGATVARAR